MASLGLSYRHSFQDGFPFGDQEYVESQMIILLRFYNLVLDFELDELDQ